MNELNVTNGIASSLDGASVGVLLTVCTFLVIMVTLFSLYKGMRFFILGAFVSGILLIVFFTSRWIGFSAGVGKDWTPMLWLGYIIGFILLSILIGYAISKTSWGKEWMDGFMDMGEST
jgi:hypothetical protein